MVTRNQIDLIEQIAIVDAIKANAEAVEPVDGEKRCRYLNGMNDAKIAEVVAKETQTTITPVNVSFVRRKMFGQLAELPQRGSVAALQTEICELRSRIEAIETLFQ